MSSVILLSPSLRVFKLFSLPTLLTCNCQNFLNLGGHRPIRNIVGHGSNGQCVLQTKHSIGHTLHHNFLNIIGRICSQLKEWLASLAYYANLKDAQDSKTHISSNNFELDHALSDIDRRRSLTDNGDFAQAYPVFYCYLHRRYIHSYMSI
jgi:hypothetical protein